MILFNRTSKLTIIAVVIIALLFFLHYIGALGVIENVVVCVTRPVLGAVYGLSNKIGENYLALQSRGELLKENKVLKDQLMTLLKEKNLYLTEKEENDFLRQQLHFLESAKYEYEIARVIGKSADAAQNALILDKGWSRGVAQGYAVLADSGVLIGKILKVEKNYSIVLLINDDASKVAAKIKNEAKTSGVVEGEFGLGLKMRLIPRAEQISENDLIVSSGLENSVPPNLIIGQVESVRSAPEELFQEASIKMLFDPQKLFLVNIIKYYKNAEINN
ncbi:MAG: rod shape-determining protein MreC [Parcubacteria group bacterium]